MQRFLSLFVALSALLLTVLPVHAQSWPVPPLDKSWQWQIADPATDGPLDLSFARQGKTRVYDIDYQFYTAQDVASLHALGQYVVAYMDVGAWEKYRPDAAQFPAGVILCSTGWSGEKYLDIRPAALAQYKALMEARFDLAKSKGFDAVEGDYQNNIEDDTCGTYDSYSTAQVETWQYAFNQWFIQAVHARGMAAVLKNAPERAAYYASWPTATYPQGYDAALTEQCWQYRECDGFKAFTSTHRPVWNAEYRGKQTNICPKAETLGLNTIRKHLNLDATIVWSCR